MVGYINREEMYIVTYSSNAKNEFVSVFKDDNFISYEINLESEDDLNFYKLYVAGYEEMANLYDGFICDIEESEDYIKMKFKIDYSIIDEEGKKILSDDLKSKEKFLENIKNKEDEISSVERYILIYGQKIKF